MTITIPTNKSEALKKKIFDAVEDGTLQTWEIRIGTVDYLTHTPAQWHDRVLMRLISTPTALEIDTYYWKANIPDEDTKSYYIGRFCEVLLAHFRKDFLAFTVAV